MKMHFNTIKRIVVFVLLLWVSTAVYGQLSKVHYIPPIGSGSNLGDQYLYISTPSSGYINVTIKPIGGSRDDWITKSIKNDSPWVFAVYNSVLNGINSPLVKELETYSNTVIKDGYIVESSDVAYVSFRINSEERISNDSAEQYHSGAYVSKGKAALGTRYRPANFIGAVGYNRNGNSSSGENFVSILATEDNTRVEIDEIPAGLSIIGYSGSFPITKDLNEGETWILGTTSSTEDIDPINETQLSGFTGTLITSDDANGTGVQKPIVVVTGSIEGTVLRNIELGNRDFGFDQITDYEKVGHEYIVVKGLGDPQTENVYVIADSDNTNVYVGNSTSPIVLNKGQYLVFNHNDYDATNDNMYITTKDSSKKIFVYQTTGYESVANQALVFVPPLSCSSKGNIDNIPLIDKIGNKVFIGGTLTIVTESDANLEVYKNGVLFANKSNTAAVNLNAIAKSVVGKTGYTTYLLETQIDGTTVNPSTALTGNISVFSDKELYVASTTFGDAASSGSYYSGFVSNPILRSDLSVSALGNCIQSDGNSNVILSTSSAYDSYQWYMYDDAGNTYVTAPGSSNGQSYSPEAAGIYRLIGKLACYPLVDYISDNIVVSICPDDFDDDGVADNLDLDIDNDGVLNAVESFGNVAIDFTNVAAPVIALPNTNPPITSAATISASSTSATFGGNSAGEILSEIPASGINEETTYSLMPILPNNEALNLHVILQENGVIENESEIISFAAFPTNKSISILDPGERLLVDVGTGFQRIPAAGFSGSTLKLKRNESPLDTSIPVEIFGRDLSGFKIMHALNASATSDGYLKFSIEIFDYKNDSDGDGVINSFELDSDDDGCNDVIEAGYEDPDNDGLGGDSPIVFDPSSGTSTADIRGRVVSPGYDYNILPLDNDNNGIYDFQEAGTPATLSQDFAAATAVLCEGEQLSLTFKSADADSVLWEVDTNADGIFEPANTLGTIANDGDTYEFLINSVTTALDQAVFRASLSKKTYACSTSTKLFTLTVNDNTTKPTLDPLTVVCKGATVADLDTTVVWYSAATGGSPLANDAVLAHNTPYFAASIVNGCIGELRSETKVVVNDPVISTVSGNTTFCAEETVMLSLDTDKILPTPDDFARINNLVFIEDIAGPVEYDNGFYYTQQGIKTGVQPITWPTAKALGESIVGATMYIINSTTEETLVYEGLQYMGLTGNDGVAFWLGLFQDRNASDYLEPDGGWYWVDGTPLTYQNWWSGEPNNAGNEDYGQFEFANNGKYWNDMNLTYSDGQSYPIFEYKALTNIEWFTIDSNGAPTQIAGVANSSQLEVSPLVTTSYFVRVTTNGMVCDSETFTITINPLPVANNVSNPIEICVDNNNGAIASTDLKGAFDLTLAEATILGGQPDTNHTVAYYTTQGGAENEIAAAKILTPEAYTNTSNPQTIYYRVTNTGTNCVSDIGELTIKANALPPKITIPDFEACDNLTSGSDEDGILQFDLSAQTASIEALLGSTTQWSVSYHETVADAEAKNAITEYTTSASDNSKKTIIVRLEDNTTGCYRIDNTLDLIVFELPKISKSSFLREQCDTDTDGIVQDNLTLYNAIFSVNHTNEKFTYYWDSNHTDEITSPSAFFNIDSGGNPIPDVTVYVKITNDNGCERTFDPANGNLLTLILKVRASGIKSSFLKSYYTCLDPSVKTNTGISTFNKAVFVDLENKLIAEHPAFANSNVTIQFFENESDAASKTNPIDTSQDYMNTTPNNQEIWAAVDANGLSETTCLGLKQVANLVVEPLAILHPVTIPSQCDGDSANDTDAEDALFPFDTSTVMSQLLLGQNPADYDITFYDKNDLVISTNGFPTEYLSPSQSIRVVVENNPSNVTPACYQEAFISFTVDDSPEVGTYNMPPVCDNDDGILDNLGVFDTSSLNTELLAGQTNMEIQFLQRDGLGNNTVIGNTLPNPFTTATTKVIAQIYNPLNTTCVAEEVITFQVNENPVFNLPTDLVYCQNLGSDTIYVTSPGATYDYAWERNGVPITTQFTQNLIISEGGTYSVTATNPVTGCATTKVVVVDPSEIALFDAEDVTIYDLTGDGSNRIEIDNSETALGIGNYEFALKLNDDPIGLYQDSPVFENVPPGIHTLYVRDKKGCGIENLVISVIGYPFYFTPNGDGTNDTWQILGVSATFQPSSLIYIFDRHGRLMAQIPADGIGWDGTYNGTAIPADDYWFRVKLEDGRSFTGHFSLIR